MTRVGINTLPLLGKSGNAGVGRYIRNLCLALAESAKPHSYVLLGQTIAGWAEYEQDWLPIGTQTLLQKPKVRFVTRLIAENSLVPLLAQQKKLDVLHYTELSAPLIPCGRPVISTIYDLKFQHYPHMYITPARLYFLRAVQHAARTATMLVTCSEATRHELIHEYRLQPENVVSISGGVDPRFTILPATEARATVTRAFGLAEPYVLFVGMLEPTKNLVRLIQAFVAAKRREGLPHKLVLAGAKGWLWEDIPQAIAALQAEADVALIGRVPEESLVALYNAADLFAFPSLYEGFGLPVLEAMACGTPVITSNVSSLPEVAGDAAVLIEPTDVTALTDAIIAVLTQPTLAVQLREAGVTRAATFTWHAVAERIRAVYEQVKKNRV